MFKPANIYPSHIGLVHLCNRLSPNGRKQHSELCTSSVCCELSKYCSISSGFADAHIANIPPALFAVNLCAIESEFILWERLL